MEEVLSGSTGKELWKGGGQKDNKGAVLSGRPAGDPRGGLGACLRVVPHGGQDLGFIHPHLSFLAWGLLPGCYSSIGSNTTRRPGTKGFSGLWDFQG